MGTLDILFLSLALAADAGAVALSAGTASPGTSPRPALRLSFHFGLFQFLMPLAGWYGGYNLEKFIEHYDHWVAFLILLAVSVKMIREGLAQPKGRVDLGLTRGFRLVMVSFATSIDAFAVGLSLAFLKVDVVYPALIIGIVTFFVSLTGFFAGVKMSARAGSKMTVGGGVILIVIGVRILCEHLFN